MRWRRRGLIGAVMVAAGLGLIFLRGTEPEAARIESLPAIETGRALSRAQPAPPRPALEVAPSADPASPDAALARFAGEVVDADGAPVVGAKIVFVHQSSDTVLHSDGDGRFAFEAEDGDWYLAGVSAPGYLGYSDLTSYRAARGTFIGGLRFELERSRRIRGKVITSAGRPVEGARISVFDELGVFAAMGGPVFDSSDKNGEFEGEMSTRRAALKRLSVSHSCCLHQTVQIPLSDSEVALTIVLAEATGPKVAFSGVVVTPTGAPVPGAQVSVFGTAPVDDAGFVEESESAQTDEHGKFSVAMRSSVVRVMAYGEAGQSDVLEFSVSDVARLVLLPREGTSAVSGRVSESSGQPVTSFTVRLVDDGRNSTSRTFLTGDGTFAVTELRARHFKVQVETEDFAASAVVDVQLKPGEKRGGVDFVLSRGAALSGTVFDERTHLPLAGARVNAERRRTTTDRAGHFELHGLPATALEVEADRDGYATRQLKVEAGRVGALNIELRKLERPDGGWTRDYEGIGVQLDFEVELDGGNGYPVTLLHPEGGARLAGMEVGDEILAADGVLPLGLAPNQFNLHVKGDEGTVVRLTIRRAGRVFDLNVVRRRLTW